MAETGDWYYQAFDIEFGPVTFDQLVGLAKSHTISRDDQVRLGEKGIWRRAGSMGKLMAHLPYVEGGGDLTDADNDSGTDFELQSVDTSVQKPTTDPLLDLDTSHLEDVDELDLSTLEDVNHLDLNLLEDAESESIPVAEPQQIGSGWWCRIQDREYGPVEWSKLVEWAVAGRLTPFDQVRFDQQPEVLAGDLPDLFPSVPATKVVETKSVASASTEKLSTPDVAIAKPIKTTGTSKEVAVVDTITPPQAAAPSRKSSPTITSPPNPQPRPTVPTPATVVSRATEIKASPIRPAVPASRPSVSRRSDPIDFSGLLIPMGSVIGGLAVVGVLIYFAYFGMGSALANSGNEVQRFKTLQEAYGEVMIMRIRGSKQPENFRPAQEKIAAVANSMINELKDLPNRQTVQDELLGLARKLREVSEEDLGATPTTAEALASGMVEVLGKRLRLIK